MKWISLFSILLLTTAGAVFSQKIVSRKQFFASDSFLAATLSTDYTLMMDTKKEPVFQPATITWQNLSAEGPITEPIQVKMRGKFRRMNCSFASLLFNFEDSAKKSRLQNLKELKVVVPCEWGSGDEQWIFKEYLIYKIYQLFTEKSFKVRLVQFTFNDVSKGFKPYKQYGFVLEDVDDLAKRNNCKEVGDEKIGSEATNRMHTTMVALFQYMISNSDWKVPVRHNIKMIRPKDSATAKPYIIPYDFDYSGAVNALYAEPAPNLGIQKVTDRLYLGFPRTLDEINASIKIFLQKENDVLSTISNFSLLDKKGKEEMQAFIQEFFTLIKDQANVKKHFIDKAITKWP